MAEQNPEGRLVSTWEAVTKDDDGEAHIHTLHKYDYPPDGDYEDMFVRQALPTTIRPSRRIKPTRSDQLTVFFPDAQIPFQDEEALQGAHMVVRELMPDNVVLLGDMTDLPAQSRFDTHPDHVGVMQNALDRTHEMLAQIRADSPDARVFYIWGNHELRLQRSIIQNNAELLGIKRANAQEELSVLTLEYLLKMQELEVEAVQGYPNGQLWLEDHTVAVHGDIARRNSSTSLEYLKRNPHVNHIHGHSHRAEIQWRTTPTRDGSVQRFAMSPGTLADINGSVPSYHSTISEHGDVVEKAEDWQHATGLVEHNKYGANPELAMIINGILRLRGEQFNLRQEA